MELYKVGREEAVLVPKRSQKPGPDGGLHQVNFRVLASIGTQEEVDDISEEVGEEILVGRVFKYFLKYCNFDSLD